ncbi:MAG: DUF1048 domain-containing protein [Thermoleophilia bacterium]|nr:DUF1048 domain-containing protein [Thermoleophilia bacterium]
MDVSKMVGKVVGDLETKRRWRDYRARAKRLPAPYRAALNALERYLMYYGGIAQGDLYAAMLSDLADLFEQAAADGTRIRAVVGEDPVEFAEDFVRNYAGGQWITKERTRLSEAIDHAVAEEAR